MVYFKKLQLCKWIFSTLIVSIAIASCTKENHTATTSNEKLSSANDVGLPPTIIGWGTDPDIPIVDQQGNLVNGVSFAFAFVINGKGYVGGGISSAQRPRTTYQYDPLTRTWTRVADFPGANDIAAATFVIGSSAYVCTGGGNGSKQNWQYNQLTNLWTRVSDFPGGIRVGAVGVAINGKGYVGLGVNVDNANDTKDWWEYDPTTDTWMKKADFPGTRRDYAVSFAINNKGYVGTGHHYNSNTGTADFFNDLYQYNPANDTWTQKADMPGPGRWEAVGASAFTNRGIVATGREGIGTILNLNDCWEYIPSSNSWFQLPNVGGGGRYGAVGFGIDNTLYIGTAGNAPHPNDFWGLTINP